MRYRSSECYEKWLNNRSNKSGLFFLLICTLSVSGVCQHPSSFWTVTQSLLRAYQALTHHVREVSSTFHKTSNSIVFIGRKAFSDLNPIHTYRSMAHTPSLAFVVVYWDSRHNILENICDYCRPLVFLLYFNNITLAFALRLHNSSHPLSIRFLRQLLQIFWLRLLRLHHRLNWHTILGLSSNLEYFLWSAMP